MNKLYQQAIILRFEGFTYEEISKRLNNKLTEGTLKNYFSMNGILYEGYLNYTSRTSKLNEEAVDAIFKRNAVYAANTIIEIMHIAMKKEKYRLALKCAEIVLDRAGLTVERAVREAEEERNKEQSYIANLREEELDKRLKESGIDPDSIKFIAERAD